MMRTVLSLILFLFTYTIAFAAKDHDALWQKANKLYEQKSYDSAAYYYGQLAALKPAEAVVYFNLGNAHYKLNEIGLAVLNYQRALVRDPSYKEAADNLSLAESRITNRIPVAPKIFFVQWWQSLTSSSTAGTWAIISVISFLLLIGFAICKRLAIIKTSIPQQALGIAWTLCFCFLLFAFIAAENRRTRDKAVVMQNDTPVYSTPAAAKSITSIQEGTTVTFDKEQDGWMEITLPDGRSGWIRSSDVSKI